MHDPTQVPTPDAAAVQAAAAEIHLASERVPLLPPSIPWEIRAKRYQEEIEPLAINHGLTFDPVSFETVDSDAISTFAAFGGFPTRYQHYRFAMEYLELAKGYEYGLQRIYEMVINNNPCFAYLLNSNTDTDQRLVMAHVYGHADFFKNNLYFAGTNKKMIDQMGNHAARIHRHIGKYGLTTVEEFIDACLSLESLIDVHQQGIRRTPLAPPPSAIIKDDPEEVQAARFRSKDYMDAWMNPPEKLEAERKSLEEKQKTADSKFPAHPCRDVLLFLLENAPLKEWQRDILTIIRDEAYYFVPQAQTKIMNEGWASYWHSTLMTKYILDPKEVVHYCDHHSGTLASGPGRLNPYKLGIELFRDIEDRWNKGRFGKEYEECDDWETKRNWDTGAGLGRQKIFEVRRMHNDLTFLDTFLTPEFCHDQKLFSFGLSDDREAWVIESRAFEDIKSRLLAQLTNRGRPIIEVTDANYQNRSELVLTHRHSGVDIKLDYAKETLVNLHKIWKRPVHLETIVDDEEKRLSFDGTKHSEADLD